MHLSHKFHQTLVLSLSAPCINAKDFCSTVLVNAISYNTLYINKKWKEKRTRKENHKSIFQLEAYKFNNYHQEHISQIRKKIWSLLKNFQRVIYQFDFLQLVWKVLLPKTRSIHWLEIIRVQNNKLKCLLALKTLLLWLEHGI